MASLRARLVIAVSPFVLLELGVPGPVIAAPYPHLIDQQHVGRRCRPEDVRLAAGTIVGVGGQVVAGGGGTGVGCDTFYAYEVRPGTPRSTEPFVEPGYTLWPGRSVAGDG